MGLSKDELLKKLKDCGVQFDIHEHAAVLTLEQQVEALPGVQGSVVKNLFLKDKKNRLYIVSAMPETKVDMNAISARLGTGKGGVRFAPGELMDSVLQVPPGSVTPLAVANPEAQKVVLFLDAKLRGVERILVHPLVNTASLSLTPSGLEAALRAVGREPIYVDLNLDPKIDKENPPDLAKYTVEPQKGAAAGVGNEQLSESPAVAEQPQVGASQSKVVEKKGSKAESKAAAKGGKSEAAPGPSMYAQQQAATDVIAHTQDILHKVAFSFHEGKTLDEVTDSMDKYSLRRLRADLEAQLTILKNTAYSMGYNAGKGAIVGYAQKHFA